MFGGIERQQRLFQNFRLHTRSPVTDFQVNALGILTYPKAYLSWRRTGFVRVLEQINQHLLQLNFITHHADLWERLTTSTYLYLLLQRSMLDNRHRRMNQLGHLDRLVARSMVQVHRRGGRSWYSLLETIRAYARANRIC